MGHLDLNSIQFCSDSLKEGIKQTMLNQELMFTGQVFELHQLYRRQTAMTEGIHQRSFDNYNSHIGSSNSMTANLNNKVKYNEADLNNLSFKKKPVDLQLSADEFIRQAAYDLSGKEVVREFPIDSNNSIQDRKRFNVNHSLTIDEDRGVQHRSLMGKLARTSRPDLIDLEDPNLMFSKSSMNLGIPSSNPCLKNKHMLERCRYSEQHDVQSFSNTRAKHEPFDDVGVSSQRRTLFKPGLNGDFMAAETSVSQRRMNLDLNTVQFDHLSCFSNSLSEVHNPVETSWRESNVRRGKPQNFIDDNKIIIIDLDSDSGEELYNIREEPKIESVGSISKLSTSLSCEIEMREIVVEEAIIEKHSSESNEVQKAAELLLNLSLERKVQKNRPQCSSESYEEIIRNAKECGPDDYCVSSNAMVEYETEKKDSRYKLKRGTRMKDFQKDILSSLSTLSRHEIREDIKMFESVLKSREYKKMRAKMGYGSDWCSPSRSKRSRISRR